MIYNGIFHSLNEIANSSFSVVETLIDMDFLKGGYESLEVNISSQNPLRLYSSPRPKFMWKVVAFQGA